ncbi:MAG: hypothetical protein ABIK93_07040 [candidate division WOR-3 bacterium]
MTLNELIVGSYNYGESVLLNLHQSWLDAGKSPTSNSWAQVVLTRWLILVLSIKEMIRWVEL